MASSNTRAVSPSFVPDGEKHKPPKSVAPCLSYKFRSEKTSFKPLWVARHEYGHTYVLDVKRSIVAERGLDKVAPGRSQPEFDLGLSHAETGEEYIGEATMIPPGVSLVVRRRPAERGLGLLSWISRAGAGLASAQRLCPKNHVRLNDAAAKAGFYTFVVKDRDDELIGGSTSPPLGDFVAKKRSEIACSLAKQWPEHNIATTGSTRPITNPDPELRQLEKQLRPAKRLFGIPRALRNMKLDSNIESRKQCSKNAMIDIALENRSEHRNRSEHNKMKRTHHKMTSAIHGLDETRKRHNRERTKRRKGVGTRQAHGKERPKCSDCC